MKRYKEFINEDITKFMTPKPEDDILTKLVGLSDNKKIEKIIKYQLDFGLLPRDENGVCTHDEALHCGYNNVIVILPDNLTINGNLYCSSCGLTKIPNNLTINGNLYCSENELTVLPEDLTVDGDIRCWGNNLTKLPDNLTVNGKLDCSGNNLTKLPDNLTTNGNLDCSGNNLTKLPDNLTTNGDLDCYDNKVKLTLPPTAKVGGTFNS